MMLIYIYCHRENVQDKVSKAAYSAVYILPFFFFLRKGEAYVCIFTWKLWNDKVLNTNFW